MSTDECKHEGVSWTFGWAGNMKFDDGMKCQSCGKQLPAPLPLCDATFDNRVVCAESKGHAGPHKSKAVIGGFGTRQVHWAEEVSDKEGDNER